MTDTEFLEAFGSCSLPEAQWTHEAHVRMAWLYLQKMPLIEAIPVVRQGIKRYNASLKKSLAYHETITHVFLILISDRMLRAGDRPSFVNFCNQNPDLLDRNMTPLLIYYRKETLFSQAARDGFVKPDLAILPDTPARF